MVTRMSISVSDNLKKRMDKIRESVNWSETARDAFERKLGEIAALKETKTMETVIQRLRASKLAGDSESTRLGHEAGQKWAKDRAEAHELERLDQFCQVAKSRGSVQELLHLQDGSYSPGEILYFAISPENDGERQSSKDFWEGYSDSEADDAALDVAFVAGFAEGAVAIWEQVESEL